MCESFENLAREMAEESAEIATENKGIESFLNAINMGLSKEDAQKIANITDEQVEKAFSLNK